MAGQAAPQGSGRLTQGSDLVDRLALRHRLDLLRARSDTGLRVGSRRRGDRVDLLRGIALLHQRRLSVLCASGPRDRPPLVRMDAACDGVLGDDDPAGRDPLLQRDDVPVPLLGPGGPREPGDLASGRDRLCLLPGGVGDRVRRGGSPVVVVASSTPRLARDRLEPVGVGVLRALRSSVPTSRTPEPCSTRRLPTEGLSSVRSASSWRRSSPCPRVVRPWPPSSTEA